jgi:hypothetical protein
MALSRDSVLMGGASLFLAICAAVVIWLIIGASGGDGTRSSITARERYDGAVQRAADLVRRGSLSEARALLDKAVTEARDRNLLPLQNYPSPGESLLWALNRRYVDTNSAAAQEFDAYIRRAYKYYQPRQADQYLAVVSGDRLPTMDATEPASRPAPPDTNQPAAPTTANAPPASAPAY